MTIVMAMEAFLAGFNFILLISYLPV